MKTQTKVYIKRVTTDKELKAVEALKARLYKKYSKVGIYPCSYDKVTIIASFPIQK